MPSGEKNEFPRNLPIDDKNSFRIIGEDGKEEIIQLTESDIYTLENFHHLVGKNKLRLEIINILQIYPELNITQISQKVEQSKSTVARHLNSLEEHNLILSRKAEDDEFETGKIRPKLYRRNKDIFRYHQYLANVVPPPEDPVKIREFYKRQIKVLRNTLAYFKGLLDKTELLTDKFESQLDNLPLARETWLKYIDEKTSPALLGIDGISFHEKYYEENIGLYKEFTQKFRKALAAQNTDPEVEKEPREHTAIFAFLPVKDLFDIYKEEVLDKKEK